MIARHWVATHPGAVRSSNEDSELCRPDLGLFAVADGVGGQSGGAEASAEVVGALAALPSDLARAELLGRVREALDGAHRRLLERTRTIGTAAATTVVVLLLDEDRFACLWAGDSRAYVLRGDALRPLTADHSVIGEMLRAGTLTEEEAKSHPAGNVITRAIGVTSDEKLLDKVTGYSEPGDRFLLCSDGLTKALDAAEIVRLLADGDPARALIDAALARGARDNVTAVVLAAREA